MNALCVEKLSAERYCLVRDDDDNMYVIPATKTSVWYLFVAKAASQCPDWAKRVTRDFTFTHPVM